MDISTDINNVGPACPYASPPQTIQPGESGCFYTAARDVFLNEYNGAGGSMTYTVTPQSFSVQDPPLAVTFAWSTPWASEGFWSLLDTNGWWAAAAVVEGVGGSNPQAQVGTTEYGYSVGWSDPGGQAVTFSLSGAPVAAKLQGTVGATGFPFSIAGTGFNGGTQVYFGSAPAIGVTCTSVLCSGTVPDVGSVQNGDIGVTVLGVAGNAVAVGSYYELPDGPKCTYTPTASTPTIPGSAAAISVMCQEQSNDVAVYQQGANGWAPTGYFDGDLGDGLILNSSVGATVTLVGCTQQTNGQFPVPGENGCDAPTSVTVPLEVIILPPIIVKGR